MIGVLVNEIRCPSGDQSASSSMNPPLFVMLVGSPTLSRRSPTLAMKMSLSQVGAPASALIGQPGTGEVWMAEYGHASPDADRWYVKDLPSGDQLAELPRVSSFWGL